MTLSNTNTEVTVAGDGLTTTFNYNFPMGGTAVNATLILTTVGGGTASVASNQFSITGVSDEEGGTFVYPLSGPPIASGESLTLKRVVPLTQNTSISDQGNFAPSAIEGGLDNLTMIAQQHQVEIDTLNAQIVAGSTSSGGGTVFSLATGTGLFGGPITGSGTVSITSSGITSGLIASQAVTYGKIQNFTASTLFGNPTTASVTGSEIALGAGLAFTGSTIKSTQLLFSQTASVTVSNTTSETTLIGGGTGSVTLTASFLTAGKTLKLFAQGYHSATSSPTLNIRFKLGTTTVSSTGNITPITASNSYWEAMANIVCITTGSSGAIFAQGKFIEAGVVPYGMVNTTSVTINTTTSLAFNATAQWSTASTTDSISMTNLVIEAESV